jgi:hypothetical protein
MTVEGSCWMEIWVSSFEPRLCLRCWRSWFWHRSEIVPQLRYIGVWSIIVLLMSELSPSRSVNGFLSIARPTPLACSSSPSSIRYCLHVSDTDGAHPSNLWVAHGLLPVSFLPDRMSIICDIQHFLSTPNHEFTDTSIPRHFFTVPMFERSFLRVNRRSRRNLDLIWFTAML